MRLTIRRVYARLAGSLSAPSDPYGPPSENAALCGLPLDGSGALLVQGLFSCSVGSGSE
jgi:hypothetical protein